ncbi:isocitrate/isopropylmalate dehydrogenase family protein [Paramicrobacterium agarici]|uniref:3-isopropylmalate dehydrogenase n=1 Tax=Paramicrobacterium agarici TaxID=630514 RepID=A0A2A9DUI9_9MICO|nr:isocitrate/isopropylmalate family dehydrogenase [Microbacterium agarici]PFG29825.1 3-isopropylmalate dehydrogenase [Microbacterium agarici]
MQRAARLRLPIESENPVQNSASLNIAVIPGDGIGPELVDAALQVMTEALLSDSIRLDVSTERAGAQTYSETGSALLPGALDRLRAADGIIKGPVGLPDVRKPDGTEGGLLGGLLRNGLDTFANVRPVRLWAGVPSPTVHSARDIDYVIVRENTEGLYLARGSGVRNHHAAADQMMMTRHGVERIVRFAFETARARSGAPADDVRRVTCVDKSNVLRSFAFFRQIFDEVSTEYPDIEATHMYADAAAGALVQNPAQFDVLVMENFLGDILSDLGAATAGGLGMCGSGNIGSDVAYFEPIHGSAPSLAGTDTANPVSQIACGAMMLRRTGHSAAADRIEAAIEQAFLTHDLRLDESGCPIGGTMRAAQTVIDHL